MTISSITFAMDGFDENRDVQFTIDYQHEGTKLAHAEFALYLVGNVDRTGKVEVTKEFSDYPVDFSSLNQESWNDYALTLKGYVQKDRLNPVLTGTTDGNGRFTSNLKAGLYLVMGQQIVMDGFRYDSTPFLVVLPGLEQETGRWKYDVTSFPKTKKEEMLNQEINKIVIKVWKDHGYEKTRPEEIEVELLGNGNLKETVTLSKENNWRHTWERLDSNISWVVVEKDLDKSKYKVAIAEEGNTFMIENTYLPPSVPKKSKGSLPQTGQLWWPVYALTGVGSIFILLGYVQDRRKKVDK